MIEGIPFLWNGTDPRIGLDCFGLANHARRLHGFPSLPDYSVIYHHFTEASFPPRLMLELLRDAFGDPVQRQVEPWDLIALKGETVGLGTVLSGEVLHFGPDKLSTLTPIETLYAGRYILGAWDTGHDTCTNQKQIKTSWRSRNIMA